MTKLGEPHHRAVSHQRVMMERSRAFPRFLALYKHIPRREQLSRLSSFLPLMADIADKGIDPISWLVRSVVDGYSFRILLHDLANGESIWPKLNSSIDSKTRRDLCLIRLSGVQLKLDAL